MSAVLEQEAKTTSLAELRKPTAPEQSMPVVRMGFETLQSFELMQRAAKLLAASTLVPKEYIGNLPNCVIALNMAQRIGADPLMVMQNLYVVHGRPGWSSKFLIASFNQCGRFSAIRFEWVSDRSKDEWGCKAWATEKATGEKIVGPLITMALAKKEGWYAKNGSKWQTIPELMLMYRSAGWLVNTHAPEISMGLNTTEELGDVFDASPDGSGNFAVTTDELRNVERVVDTSTGEIIQGEPDKQPDPGPGDAQTGPTNASAKAEVESGAPKVEFEKLLHSIQMADSVDVLDNHASLIGAVDGMDRQNTLAEKYKSRRAELTAPKGKK